MTRPFLYAVADNYYKTTYAAAFLASAHATGHQARVFCDGANVSHDRDKMRYCTWRYRLLPEVLSEHPAAMLLDVDTVIRKPIEIEPEFDLGLFTRNSDKEEDNLRTLGGIFYCTARALEFASELATRMSAPNLRWGDDQGILWRTYQTLGAPYRVKLFTPAMIDWEPKTQACIFTGKGAVKDRSDFRMAVSKWNERQIRATA